MNDETIRLLAIDDNADNLITIRALISDAFPSATLHTSLNGIHGIELAISEDPHVILLDVVMPGMDGLAVCRQLKADERSHHIPVIMLTALKSDRQIRVDALEAGAEAFLSKPLDEVELVAQVKAMIKIKAAGVLQRREKEQLTSLVKERTLAIEKELLERRETEKKLQEANLKLKQTQAATLELIEDLKVEMAARTKNEAELIRAKEKAEESDRLKSAFLANMSHEIRTPMNGIIGFSGLLSEPDVNIADRDHYIKVINDNCQQLLHIVSDIIDISKIEAGLIEIDIIDFCLNELMDSLLENYLPKATLKGLAIFLHKEMVCPDCSISGDQSKIRQVLDYLLTNALKFTAQGQVNFGYRFIEGKLQFFVEDTGIGIAPEHQEVIFNRFWQVETGRAKLYGGTGLGLSISRAFIRKLGGDMHVESEQGKGSRFIVNIPYNASIENRFAKLHNSIRPDNFQGKTILVVEDEADNFEYLQIILEKLNFIVLHAWNGNEALLIFSEHPEINLVLMDFKLPDISGQEVTRQIIGIRKDIPVIATTAYAMSGDRAKALQTGCVDYLPKPIRPEEMAEMLRKYLGRNDEG